MIDEISKSIEPTINELGFILWGIDVKKVYSKVKTLIIYIDKKDGVNINDCGYVSDIIAPILDTYNFIEESYNLEISSPGIDRRIFNKIQALEFINYEVNVKIPKRSKVKGILKKVGDDFYLQTKDEEILIDFESFKINLNL